MAGLAPAITPVFQMDHAKTKRLVQLAFASLIDFMHE
jgi:hypothetical protein